MHSLAQLIRCLVEVHRRLDWQQEMLIENNKIIRQMAQDRGTDVTKIAGVGPAHPPPPPTPLLHMEASPRLGIGSLELNDNASNASSRSRDSAKSDEPGKFNAMVYSWH